MADSETRAKLVLDLARRYDRERLLTCLFTPTRLRPTLAALVLLHAELARIPELVTEPMAGLVRYQWWREEIGHAAAGRGGAHPALDLLVPALAEGRISVALLHELLAAHEGLFERGSLAGLAELEAYATRTSGLLQRLLTDLLTDGREDAMAAAERIGTAYGIVAVLRAASQRGRSGLFLLPGEGREAREALAAAALERARDRLRGLTLPEWRKLDPPARLLARLAMRRLRSLARTGPEAGRPRLHGDPLLPLRLLVWGMFDRLPPRG